MLTPIDVNNFNFAGIYKGLQAAQKSNLTLCIDREGGWACETSGGWLPNQLCRISHTSITCAQLEAEIRSHVAALESMALEYGY
jgi:hypothetical protein